LKEGIVNTDYIEDAGKAVRRSLVLRGETVELAYTPGNMTQYNLVFLPVGADNSALVAAADWMDNEKARSIFRGDYAFVQDDEGWTLVSWIGHGAVLLQLGGDNPSVPAAPYLHEKFGPSCTYGDAEALAALFDVVAFGANRPRAVIA
jgi:hypothetical protein